MGNCALKVVRQISSPPYTLKHNFLLLFLWCICQLSLSKWSLMCVYVCLLAGFMTRPAVELVVARPTVVIGLPADI